MRWLFLLAVTVSSIFAQRAVTSATVTGRAEDSSGALVCGITIDMTNLDTNQAWAAVTDDDGRYRFSFLPVGSYRLRAEVTGFEPFARQVILTVGQAFDVPVRLSVAGSKERVEVRDEPPLVEAVRTQVAETIVPREMDSLPLNGRNYLDLALLTPAVSRTNTGNNERFAETSAVPGTGLSVAGQRNLNNGFLVDGVSANDDAADLAGTFYSQEVIREFQVVTSGAIAEFGRASAGAVNVLTRSGTNRWQGRLYGFLRDQRVDARNPFATRKDPLTQTQYGATAGGPLVRNRTFLFSNFEQTRLHRAGFVTISPANVEGVNAALARAGYRGPRAATGEFATGFHATNYFARLDHALSGRHQLSARYNAYDISSRNARNAGGLNDVSRGTGLENRDQTFALSEAATLSPRTVNETRFQFTRSRLAAPVNDRLGPAINISGVASLGVATFSPEERSIDLVQVMNNTSTSRGAHFLKAGADFLYNRVNIVFPGALQGVYTFANLAALQASRYITLQQAFGEPAQFQSNPNLGLFMQEEWRPRPDLTINAGLRYDLQSLPDPIRTDRDNLGPRFGLAFAPRDQKTVVRASYGIHVDRVPLRATSNALQRDGLKYKVAVVSFGEPAAPVFPSVLAGFPAGLLTSITAIDPGIRSGYAQQANVQIERELTPKTSLSVGYLWLRGRNLILSRNVNVPTLTAAEAARLGVSNLGRPDPRFANISRYESIGDSYYDGLMISFQNRAARWAGVRVSYTYSKAIDTAGNFFFSSPQNSFNVRDERGLSNNDQRHRLTLSGRLEVPRTPSGSAARRLAGGIQGSYIFSYSSALPFNVQTGTDRNNDTNVNDRPAGVGRNTGRGFDSATLDLRLSRRFDLRERWSLEALVESFNTLNRTNYMFPNNIFGSGATPVASFGRPTAAGDARQVQFGLRLNF